MVNLSDEVVHIRRDIILTCHICECLCNISCVIMVEDVASTNEMLFLHIPSKNYKSSSCCSLSLGMFELGACLKEGVK